jgi:hypothetical protein
VDSSAAVDFSGLLDRVRDHSIWGAYLGPERSVGVHLAVFSEPFLSFVLSGRKTLESRFSRFRIAPFDAVAPGDVILIKAAAGPIRGIALAQRTWFFDLSSAPIRTVREQFSAGICADDKFWDDKRDAVFATIIELAELASIEPLGCHKRDRRGWVTLRSRDSQLWLW